MTILASAVLATGTLLAGFVLGVLYERDRTKRAMRSVEKVSRGY